MEVLSERNITLPGIEKKMAKEMTGRFISWVESVNYESYDWWDIWGSSWGSKAKQLFHKNKALGSLAVAPVILADIIYPSFRKFFVEKRQFPVSTSQIALGYLHLFESSQDSVYLHKAESMVPGLLGLASPAAHDLGWGIRHEWTTVQGHVSSDTPCHTQTAYAYEFFAKLVEHTGKKIYEDYLARIAKHICFDYPEWKEDNLLISAYSTMDNRRVVNANAYRMYMLLDAAKRFGDETYLEKGLATLNYVLSTQNKDGSFPYSADQSFVDGFHTCFVLKNLFKSRRLLNNNSVDLEIALNSGMDYYSKHLIDADGYPVPFSVKPRSVLYQYDSYDFAECIGLYVDLNMPKDKIIPLLKFVKARFQTKEGWFSFRLFPGWNPKGIPYMRSANAAMFLALTKVS